MDQHVQRHDIGAVSVVYLKQLTNKEHFGENSENLTHAHVKMEAGD